MNSNKRLIKRVIGILGVASTSLFLTLPALVLHQLSAEARPLDADQTLVAAKNSGGKGNNSNGGRSSRAGNNDRSGRNNDRGSRNNGNNSNSNNSDDSNDASVDNNGNSGLNNGVSNGNNSNSNNSDDSNDASVDNNGNSGLNNGIGEGTNSTGQQGRATSDSPTDQGGTAGEGDAFENIGRETNTRFPNDNRLDRRTIDAQQEDDEDTNSTSDSNRPTVERDAVRGTPERSTAPITPVVP